MKMITALLKASFLVVLSMLMFTTASNAQNKAAQQTDEKPSFVQQLHEQGITFEKASADLAVWKKAMANLPDQGKAFTPEQYELAENYIKGNIATLERQVAALKPTVQSSTE